MANRVVFGNRNNTNYGLYISKPGFNALTAAFGNLLFSSDNSNPLQIVQSATVAVSVGSFNTITYPNLGYVPTVLVIPHITAFVDTPTGIRLDFHCSNFSNTSCRINVVSPLRGFTYTGTCTYAVLRMRYDG